jgi:hypothetical protein
VLYPASPAPSNGATKQGGTGTAAPQGSGADEGADAGMGAKLR